MVKIGKFEYFKSTRPDKKLMVEVTSKGKTKTVHFGDRNMEHYKDKSKIWSSKDHLDKDRRKNYLSRSGGIKDKSGNLTKNDIFSPNYHSRRVLW